MRYWKSTADMMSDKEKQGSKYIRHQSDYHSERFNSFMNKLDEQNDQQNPSHARFKREIGSPVKKPVPSNAKPWMLKEAGNAEAQEATCNENQLSGDAGEITDEEPTDDV